MKHKNPALTDFPTSGVRTEFTDLFASVLRRQRGMALASALGKWGMMSLVLIGLYALIDIYYPLEDGLRLWISPSLGLILVVLLVILLIRGWRLSPCAVARHVDSCNGDVRQTVLSCLEMTRSGSPGSPSGLSLSSWLMAETEHQAGVRLSEYMGKCHIWHVLGERSVWLFLQLLILCIGLGCWQRNAVEVLYGRLCTPWEDVPPLSFYHFELVDSPSSVVYGEDALMQVRVTGAPVAGPVEIWIRSAGYPVQKLTAFRDASGIWARRLEKLTAPCQIAFAVQEGKARSRWFPLEVNYQPKVVRGSVIVSSPEYVKQPRMEYSLNGQDVALMDGGTADFVLESNRPLMSGTARFTPDRKDIESTTVQGILLPDGRISFPLKVRQSGVVSIQMHDFRGTGMERPLENRVKVTADARPSVVIHKPQPVSMIMEDMSMPVHVEVQDNYGLAHVAWIRQVNGSRPRSLDIPLGGEDQKSLFLAEQISLPALGIKAGDVLQFSAEARDANPYLLNMTVSDPVVVHVISDAQYRELLRIRTSTEEFLNKYRLFTEAIDQIVKELDRVKAGNPHQLSKEEAANLLEQHREARKLVEKIAKDFPIFETDGTLAATAETLAGIIKENEGDLSGELPGDQSSTRNLIQKLRDRLESPRQDLSGQHQEAEKVACIMKGYEMLMAFRKLSERQKEVADMLSRFLSEQKAGRRVTMDHLSAIGQSQDEVMQQYQKWLSGAPEILDALPMEAAEFKQEMDAFLAACAEAGIDGLMKQSLGACSAGRERDAADGALKAYEAMMKLLGEDAAAGKCMKGQICPVMGLSQKACASMQQLLDSLLCRNQCRNPGVGNFGVGSGAEGESMMNIPMTGPGREKFPEHRAPGAGPGKGPQKEQDGGKGTEGASAGSQDTTQQDAASSKDAASQQNLGSPALQQVPPMYRNAVKQYFEQSK